MSSQLFDSKYCALVAQPTAGTFVLPNPAADSLLLLNGSSDITAEYFEQEVSSATFEATERSETRVSGFIEGDIRLVGHPTAGTAPPIDFALTLAGHTATTTIAPNIVRRYKPLTKVTARASGRWHQDEEFSYFKDMAAVWQSITMNIGEVARMRWRAEGDLSLVGDLVIPTGLYPNAQTPDSAQTANSICRVGGVNVPMYGLEFSANAQLQSLPDTELLESFLAGRKPGGVIRVKKQQLALFDWYGIGNNKLPLVFVQTNATNTSLGFRFDAPLCQFGKPKKTNRSSQFAYEIEFRPLKNIGDDAYSFEVGNVATV